MRYQRSLALCVLKGSLWHVMAGLTLTIMSTPALRLSNINLTEFTPQASAETPVHPEVTSRPTTSSRTSSRTSSLTSSDTSSDDQWSDERWRALSELDETCGDCHPEEVKKWRASPMGSSFKLMPQPQAERRRPIQILHQTQHSQTAHTYTVATELGGALRFEQAKVEVSDARYAYIAIGGTHAETYLWRDETSLFEAPLTRYGSKWGLSPGYEQRDHGLYRPITSGCLQCHAEPVYRVPYAHNRYQRLPQSGIGCARCHGDTRAHVRGRYAGEETPALNPAHMPPQRAQEVCDQCHFGGAIRVTRAGKQWADHHPEAPLSDTIAIFARAERTRGLSSVSHGDRLRLSACSQESPQLGCATCHPPHAQTLKDPNTPCRGCHSSETHPQVQQTLTLASPKLSSGSSTQTISKDVKLERGCVSCHMRREGLRNVPHLSTLDHWIRREPTPEPAPQNSDAELVWVNRPSHGHTGRNISRAQEAALLGRAYYKAWRQGGLLNDLRRAYLNLTAGLEVGLSEADAWFTLAELCAEVSLKGQLPALSGEVGAQVALDAAERARQLGATHGDLPLLLSDLYMRHGRVMDAQRVIAEALKVDPRRGDLLRQAAKLSRAIGATDEALKRLKVALEINPFDLRSLFERAVTFQGARRWREARPALKRLLSLEPRWTEARLNLGWLELQDHRPKEALVAFREAESQSSTGQLPPPLLAQALSGQALSLEANGELARAIPIAQRALETRAPAPGVMSLLGRGALAERRMRDAVTAFSFATRAQPDDGPAWWGLSQAQLGAGDVKAARASAERAASLGVTEAKMWLSKRLPPQSP